METRSPYAKPEHGPEHRPEDRIRAYRRRGQCSGNPARPYRSAFGSAADAHGLSDQAHGKRRSGIPCGRAPGGSEISPESQSPGPEKINLVYDDGLFQDFVLKNRITRYEPWSAYRSSLLNRFGKWVRGGVTKTALRVNEFTAKLRPAPRTPLSPAMTPLQAVRSGSVALEMDRGIACVAILRSLGIPARYLEQWGWVEFHDGKDWRPLYPKQPDQLGNRKAHDAAARYYNDPASLLVSFTLAGKPLPP